MEIDLKTLTKLIFKLVGMYLLVSIIVSIPFFIAEPDPFHMRMPTFLYGIALLIVSMALIWFPGAISNGLLRLPGARNSEPADGHLPFRLAIALLGIFFAVTGLRNIGYIVCTIVLGPFVAGHQQELSLTGWSIELLLGLVCMTRPGLVERLTDFRPHVRATCALSDDRQAG